MAKSRKISVHIVACASVLTVLCFCNAIPIDAAQVGTTSGQKESPAVRIDIPKPSPQQFPSTSVLPAGIDTASGSYPSSSSNSSSSSGTSTRRGEFVIAPIPFSNEAFSFGLVPVVAYVFRIDQNDKSSPPSTALLTGLVATGDSWALGGGGKFYFRGRPLSLHGVWWQAIERHSGVVWVSFSSEALARWRTNGTPLVPMAFCRPAEPEFDSTFPKSSGSTFVRTLPTARTDGPGTSRLAKRFDRKPQGSVRFFTNSFPNAVPLKESSRRKKCKKHPTADDYVSGWRISGPRGTTSTEKQWPVVAVLSTVSPALMKWIRISGEIFFRKFMSLSGRASKTSKDDAR